MATSSPKVCVSIPTRGSLRAETVEWLLRAFVQLAPDVEVQIVHTPYPIDHQRNLQVIRFLESPFAGTHLFLLDSACVPKEGTLQRLLAYDLPIVSAPGNQLVAGEVGPMAVDRRNGGYVQHHPLDGLQRVDAVGAAGLLVRREVFERLGSPWFRTEYDKQGLISKGEDFYFCEKAQEHGYEILADCSLVQQHIKDVVL